MVRPLPVRRCAAAWLALMLCAGDLRATEPMPFTFTQKPGRLEITGAGHPPATYVYQDSAISRPYFAHVLTLSGVQVTRNHPPVAGKDATDHAELHPGLWLAFGDLSGADFWRNKAKVVHEKFVEPPRSRPGVGAFMVSNLYRSADGTKVLARETCRCSVESLWPAGLLLVWDSEFRPGDGELVFGDQEEMGLGIRLATPLTVRNGGQITGSGGEKNEKQVRGQQLDWCDYSGVADGKRAGVLLVPDPRNFRRCWFHARDYGLLVANPFARKSLGRGEASRVVVRPGEALRLRFGVLIHDGPLDLNAGAKYVLELLAREPEPRK